MVVFFLVVSIWFLFMPGLINLSIAFLVIAGIVAGLIYGSWILFWIALVCLVAYIVWHFMGQPGSKPPSNDRPNNMC